MDSKNNNKKKHIFMRIDIFLILILLSTFLLSIGYAKLSSSLSITGSASAETSEGIFISSASYYDSSSTNTASYSEIKSSLMFYSYVELENDVDSYYTVAVTVYNNSGNDKYFGGITVDEDVYSNSEITYEYSGISLNDVVLNGSSCTFYIKFYYDTTTISSTTLEAYLGIVFNDQTTYSASTSEELLAAVEALTEDGGEIVLTGDVTVSESLVFDCGGDVTLTLGGNTLNATSLSDGNKLITVTGSTNLTVTIEDGSLASNEIGIYMDSSFTGTVTLDGITLNTTGDCAIRNSGSGTIIIKDCTIVSTQWAALNNNSTGSAYIYNSTLTGSNYATKNDGGGTVTIYSGTFKGGTTVYNSSGTTTVYGGSFYDTSFSSYLASGYSYSQDSDTGYYVVEESTT